jgi:hypothetical protein
MTKGTTSALVSGGQQYEAGSLMEVFISPDDDRRAGACAPLTLGVRQPVAEDKIGDMVAAISSAPFNS